MRIGCLFGTFDPPHKGHVAIAEHMLTSWASGSGVAGGHAAEPLQKGPCR